MAHIYLAQCILFVYGLSCHVIWCMVLLKMLLITFFFFAAWNFFSPLFEVAYLEKINSY